MKKKSKDDFETNKEWRNHKKETKEVRKAENNLNIAQKRFDLVENVIKDFANVDEVNFDKLNTLTTINHLGEEVNIDVIVTVGNANMHGGAFNIVGKNVGSLSMFKEASIVISPKYKIGSDAFAHEGGHIFGAAKDFVKYWNSELPKDYKSCQDPNLKTHPRVSMALEWQKSYNDNLK